MFACPLPEIFFLSNVSSNIWIPFKTIWYKLLLFLVAIECVSKLFHENIINCFETIVNRDLKTTFLMSFTSDVAIASQFNLHKFCPCSKMYVPWEAIKMQGWPNFYPLDTSRNSQKSTLIDPRALPSMLVVFSLIVLLRFVKFVTYFEHFR